ncbi:MAG: site-specific DNA-methyltransferase, partial [Spirochaetales bacterium]|nr:site-specific DNA-methyltransferase [Spirochaetales bacterium]
MKIAKRSELVSIDQIIPYARNARTHSKDQIIQIRASFREFGVISPLVVDEHYNLLVGHGRLEAARAEGLDALTCIVVEHLTEAQKRAYIIADNRLALNAGWDAEMLSVEIADLQGADFDVSLLGFDDAELNKLMSGIEDVKDDDFDVDAELKKPAVTKPGDLWLLGNHRLVCGDSTKPETFALLMDGKQANLVVTDPPYNVNYEGTAGKIKNDNMADDKFYQFLLDAFRLTEKAMARDASIYVFHADTEGLNFRKAFSDAGFYLSGTCIWKKQSLVLGRSPYQWCHEPILYGWKKAGKHVWYSDRKQTTIWEFDKP